MNITRYPEEFGPYRYRLKVEVSDPNREPNAGHLAVVMLNPATIHEDQDLVVKRQGTRANLIRLAQQHGYHTLTELDLFAYRSPDKKLLNKAIHEQCVDPVGTKNDAVIIETINEADTIVVAWGRVSNKPAFAARAAEVEQLLKTSGKPLHCLGKNRDGSPKHPARGTNLIQPWP